MHAHTYSDSHTHTHTYAANHSIHLRTLIWYISCTIAGWTLETALCPCKGLSYIFFTAVSSPNSLNLRSRGFNMCFIDTPSLSRLRQRVVLLRAEPQQSLARELSLFTHRVQHRCGAGGGNSFNAQYNSLRERERERERDHKKWGGGEGDDRCLQDTKLKVLGQKDICLQGTSKTRIL